MKIRLLSYGIKNIRNFKDIKIKLNEKKITMIMMPNGTGKTTSIDLIKCALSGNLEGKHFINSFKPSFFTNDISEFTLRISIDDEFYIIRIEFDFTNKTVKYYYTDTKYGEEIKRPIEFEVFTDEFVEKFIFDGELAKEFLNSESAYAEESVKNIYHLEKMENLVEKINIIKSSLISESDKTKASNDSGLTLHNGKLNRYLRIKEELVVESQDLELKLSNCDNSINNIQSQIDNLYSSNTKMQTTIETHKKSISDKSIAKDQLISKVANDILHIHNLSNRMWSENKELINALVQMKLPKSVSEQFFIDLVNHATVCICGRPMEQAERKYIKENYKQYLEENNISILNEVKSYAKDIKYLPSVEIDIDEISEHEKEMKRLEMKIERAKSKIDIEQKEEKEMLESSQKELIGQRKHLLMRYEQITSVDDFVIVDYRIEDNLKKINAEITSLNKIINQVEANRRINLNSQRLIKIINETKEKLLIRIKENVLAGTNNKVNKIIQNDNIIVESIDRYVKIKDRAGISMGQSLSVAYSFISALFDNSFYDLPFLIDSPAGSLDNDYRTEVAQIIPRAFDQLVMFVISSERPYFTETISKKYKNDVKYYTIYKDGISITVDEEQTFFNNFQERSVDDV